MHRTALAGHWRHALGKRGAACQQRCDMPAGIRREIEA